MNRPHNDSPCRPDKSSNFTKDIQLKFTGVGAMRAAAERKGAQIGAKDDLHKQKPGKAGNCPELLSYINYS